MVQDIKASHAHYFLQYAVNVRKLEKDQLDQKCANVQSVGCMSGYSLRHGPSSPLEPKGSTRKE